VEQTPLKISFANISPHNMDQDMAQQTERIIRSICKFFLL